MLMIHLAEWLVDGAWLRLGATERLRSMPAPEFAAAALDRWRRKVKRDGRGLETADDEARHELRKHTKKLRYASEDFARLFAAGRARRRRRKFVKALEDLQDRLGELNDLATAPEVLERLGIADGAAAESLPGEHDKPKLIAAAARSHAALVEAKRFWSASSSKG